MCVSGKVDHEAEDRKVQWQQQLKGRKHIPDSPYTWLTAANDGDCSWPHWVYIASVTSVMCRKTPQTTPAVWAGNTFQGGVDNSVVGSRKACEADQSLQIQINGLPNTRLTLSCTRRHLSRLKQSVENESLELRSHYDPPTVAPTALRLEQQECLLQTSVVSLCLIAVKMILNIRPPQFDPLKVIQQRDAHK